jgi:HEAT repeat protein
MTPRLRLSLAAAAALSILASAAGQGQQNPALADLLNQYRSTTVFWRQFEVAKQIAKMGDTRVLVELEPWLGLDDRHLRGNAAFVFASLGDPRGFETLRTMLTDRSDRPLGQGIPGAPGNAATPKWWLKEQVRADRYHAVHLFGELKDPRAVDVLLPLLGDEDINYHVAWALGEIGDPRAIRPLIGALKDRDALMRVSAIQALEKLKAVEALPQLRALLNDQAFPRAGDRVSVAETAKAAIARLQKEP